MSSIIFSNQTTTLHYVLFASVVLAEKLTTQSRSTLPRCCTQQHNCSVNVVSSTSLQPPMYYHTYKYCKMDLAHIMYHYGFDDGYDTTIAGFFFSSPSSSSYLAGTSQNPSDNFIIMSWSQVFRRNPVSNISRICAKVSKVYFNFGKFKTPWVRCTIV